MWGSIFSFSGGKFFFKWPSCPRRELTLYIDKPLPIDTPVDILQSHVLRLSAQATIEHRTQIRNSAQRNHPRLATGSLHKKVVDSTGVELTGRDASHSNTCLTSHASS